MNRDVDWHSRFSQQAEWTRDLRKYLFAAVGLPQSSSILEIGCGTGAILADIPEGSRYKSHGLDIDANMIAQAASHVPSALLTIGDAHDLPHPSNSFDITFCHYLLLWVASPLQVLQEMKRVTKPGAVVMVMAESDYNSRIDKPESLIELGKLQTASLLEQGADVGLGARLDSLFKEAEIEVIESGQLENMNKNKTPIELSREGDDLEWQVLASDVKATLTQDQLNQYRKNHFEAIEKETRILHVPTNFAWGLV